jgi:hypothetical protein
LAVLMGGVFGIARAVTPICGEVGGACGRFGDAAGVVRGSVAIGRGVQRGDRGPRREREGAGELVAGRLRRAEALWAHVAREECDGGASTLNGVAEGDAFGVVGAFFGRG